MSWFKRKPPNPSPPRHYRGIPTVKFDALEVTESVRAEIRGSVGRIEGLKPSAFDSVYQAALQSVCVGRGLHVLSVALLGASIDGMTELKAGNIALHLNNRASSIMDRERLRSLDITHSKWLYSGAPCDPLFSDATPEQDAAHAAANGMRYENSKGLFVNGKLTWPGWEEGCKCIYKPIIPGFD
jgi:hypothetical protein